MFNISVSDGLAIAGTVLGILLIVLDKAGKLKAGSVLFILLAVAFVMTIPLALGNSWVVGAGSSMARVARSLFAVCVCGAIFALMAVWIAIPEEVESVKEEASKKANTPITLHELFAADFSESFGFGFAPRGMRDSLGRVNIMIEGRLLVDINAGSKFVSFYIPRSDVAYAACTLLADKYQDVGGLNLFHLQLQGPSGPIFTQGYKFSGRVFIYHEDFFTPEQIGDLHRLYKQKELLLELRSEGYRQVKALQRLAQDQL